MTEPTTLGENQPEFMIRMQRVLAERGIDLSAGPVDDDLSPDEDPLHPEYRRRRRMEFNLRRWEAATPKRYREATATHPQVIAWADRAIADLDNAGVLILTGPFGTGKTHESYGALRRIAEAGITDFGMIATSAPDMYALLRPGGSEQGIQHEINKLKRIPLLLIDDVGTEKISEFTEEATYRLLDERYKQLRPLIITSNLLIRDTHGGRDLAGVLGERIVSRLAQDATVVPMTGDDRRRDRS